MNRRGWRSDEGVSVVVGAVLLLAIVLAGLIAFRLTYVPVAGERAEHDHARDVSRAMANLNAEVLDGVRDANGVPFPTSVPVAADYPPLVPGPSSGGTMEFAPGGRSVALEAPSITVLARDGEPVASDEWEPVNGVETRTGIEQVLQLRVRLALQDPGALAPGDGFEVRLEDPSGASIGRLEVKATGEDQVDLRTFNGTGERVYFERVYENVTSDWQDGHAFNLLSPTYGFDALARSEEQLSVTLEELGPVEIDLLLTYEETVGGITRLVGSGESVDGFSRTDETGTLSFGTAYRFFVRPTYVLDHGAMVVEQDGRDDLPFFEINPPLRVEATGDAAKLHLLVPSVTGDGFSVSGGDRVHVHTTPHARESLQATAEQITLTIQTTYPSLWADHLNETLDEEGLGGAYQTQVSLNEVTLTLEGPQGATSEDISLNYRQGDVRTGVTR